jgi:hypothetical protein
MGFGDQRRSVDRPWRLLLAILCVLLVVVSGTLQIAHTHADGADTHANCSLCAAAHITVHLAQAPVPVPVATVISVLHAVPRTVASTALCTFALFTRPPPADVVPA